MQINSNEFKVNIQNYRYDKNIQFSFFEDEDLTAIEELLEDVADINDMLSLMKSIHERLRPEIFIIFDCDGKKIVADGNRRLAAIKLMQGKVKLPDNKKYKKINDFLSQILPMDNNIILNCEVYYKNEENKMKERISKLHTGDDPLLKKWCEYSQYKLNPSKFKWMIMYVYYFENDGIRFKNFFKKGTLDIYNRFFSKLKNKGLYFDTVGKIINNQDKKEICYAKILLKKIQEIINKNEYTCLSGEKFKINTRTNPEIFNFVLGELIQELNVSNFDDFDSEEEFDSDTSDNKNDTLEEESKTVQPIILELSKGNIRIQFDQGETSSQIDLKTYIKKATDSRGNKVENEVEIKADSENEYELYENSILKEQSNSKNIDIFYTLTDKYMNSSTTKKLRLEFIMQPKLELNHQYYHLSENQINGIPDNYLRELIMEINVYYDKCPYLICSSLRTVFDRCIAIVKNTHLKINWSGDASDNVDKITSFCKTNKSKFTSPSCLENDDWQSLNNTKFKDLYEKSRDAAHKGVETMDYTTKNIVINKQSVFIRLVVYLHKYQEKFKS